MTFFLTSGLKNMAASAASGMFFYICFLATNWIIKSLPQALRHSIPLTVLLFSSLNRRIWNKSATAMNF